MGDVGTIQSTSSTPGVVGHESSRSAGGVGNESSQSAGGVGNESSQSVGNRKHINKVLVFGRKGCGKSVIANALVGERPDGSSVEHRSGQAGTECTREIQIKTGREWTVVDTVGLGETDDPPAQEGVSNAEATEKLTQFLKDVKGEYSHLIYVIKADRPLTVMDELIWLLFTVIFDGGEAAFTVLFTAANETWIEEQSDRIPEYLKKYHMVATDIPPVHKLPLRERTVRVKRRATIRKLRTDLEGLFQGREYEYVVPRIARIVEEPMAEVKRLSMMGQLVGCVKRLLAKARMRVIVEAVSNLLNCAGFLITVVQLPHD